MKRPSVRCFSRSMGQVRLAQLSRPAIFLLLVVLAAVPTTLMAQVTAPDFSIVLFPDTQNESQFYPQVLNTQTQWVVNNRANLNIQAVLGLGDIVNDGASATQQQNADAAIKMLDNAGVPYLLAIGNHDYDGANTGATTRTATGFNQWWGPSRYTGKSYYLGSSPSGSNENFYGMLTINGKQYLILVLEYYPRQASLDWAAGVLQANPDKETIVVTHSYMYVDGTRVDTCDTGDMSFDTNFVGDVVWDKLISKYANIIMVVNGHFTSGLASRRADLGVNGNLVNQMFSNYQDQPNGGDGWLRLLTFHPGSNTIDVKTYSPFLQTYKTDGANQFTINWHDPGLHTGAGKITGRVKTKGCQILPGATVTAGTSSTTTDANGNFSFSVAPSTYSVNVAAAGEQAQTRTVKVNDNYSTDADFFLNTAANPPCTLSTVNRTVTICTPASNATVTSPAHVVAGSTDTTAPIIRMEIWVDGVKQYTVPAKQLDAYVSLAGGTHKLTVVAAESDTSYFKAAEYITIGSSVSAPTVQLAANPTTVSAGQSSTLSWSSTNATSVTITGVTGTFGPSGTTTVTPSATTTYTATATGSGGTATSSATVTVSSTVSAPTVQLSANPASISAGQSSTLSWSSTNATSVTISGVAGTFGPSGTTTVTPSATTTYTATATGSGGTATSSATVTVQSASGCTLSTVNRTVTICTPAPNTTVSSPVHVVAGVTDTTAPIIRMEIWVDGVKVYTVATNSLDTFVTMSTGTRRLVVVAAESDASYFKATEYITVQ